MVRLFTALCKSFFEIISEKDIFDEATGEYSCPSEACPRCGAIGKLAPYGDYTRGLIYEKGGRLADSKLKPLRFKCGSCHAAHALLPDVVIPYGRYSLRFVLTVLIAYFERATTVEKICCQFGIAISTLYEWKKRMAAHKDLMLGVLASSKTKAKAYLRDLLNSGNLSARLQSFFLNHGFSFMQNRSVTTTRSNSP
jgi:hypothetical protein